MINFHDFSLGFLVAAALAILVELLTHHRFRLSTLRQGFRMWWDFKVRKVTLDKFITERVIEGYELKKRDGNLYITKGNREYILHLANKGDPK